MNLKCEMTVNFEELGINISLCTGLKLLLRMVEVSLLGKCLKQLQCQERPFSESK